MSSWDLTPYDKKLVIGFLVLVVVVVGGCMLMNAVNAVPAGCPSKGCGKPRAVSALMAAKTPSEQNALGYHNVTFVGGARLEEIEKGKEQAMVFYYSKGCGFCHRALPEFLQAANSVKPGVHLYAVEAANVATPNPLVRGFPTVILYGLPGAQKPEAIVGAQKASDYIKLFERYH